MSLSPHQVPFSPDLFSLAHMRELFERMEGNHFLPSGTPGHGFDDYFNTNASGPSACEGYDDLLTIVIVISDSLGGKTNVTSDLNALSPTRYLEVGVFGGTLYVDEK